MPIPQVSGSDAHTIGLASPKPSAVPSRWSHDRRASFDRALLGIEPSARVLTDRNDLYDLRTKKEKLGLVLRPWT